MNIGYAVKIGARTIRSSAETLRRIDRIVGTVRLGGNGPTVHQAAAAGIIVGLAKKASVTKKAEKIAELYAEKTAGAGSGSRAGLAGKVVKTRKVINTGKMINRPSRSVKTAVRLVKLGRKFL